VAGKYVMPHKKNKKEGKKIQSPQGKFADFSKKRPKLAAINYFCPVYIIIFLIFWRYLNE